MMFPARFAGALALLIATTVNVDAVASHQDLTNVALSATKTVPQLRAKESKRKNRYGERIRSLNVKQLDVKQTRALEGDADEDADADGYDGDADADADADYSDYYNGDWGNYANSNAGFAMSDYSFKYTGCSTLQTYNDELAGYGEDNVLSAQRFATFRLCQDCSDYSGQGCNSDFGEYVVAMDQFLLAMTEFNEERVIGYCEYCQTCANVESFKAFIEDTTELKTATLESNTELMGQWMEDNAIGDDDGINAAEQYYQYVKYGGSNNNANGGYDADGNQNQNGNYANNYQNGNYANQNNNGYNANGGYSANGWNNGYNGYNGGYDANQQQQWWSNVGQNNDEDGNNGGSSSYNKQQDWSFGQYGSTFMGQQVLPGYYDQYGVFTEGWGFDGYDEDGVALFVSLEAEDNMDEWISLFGELPEDWDEDWIEQANADEIESCNYDYASTCYSQYASCMLILEDEDFVAAYEETYGEMVKMADFLECTAVDWDGQDKTYYQYYMANCEEGEDCDGNGNQDNGEDGDEAEEQTVYVGPTCSGGSTIKLAVYSDQYCSQVTELTIRQVLGDVLMDDDSNGSPIDMIPQECVSCQSSEDDLWYETEEVEGGDDGLNPMCAMLYTMSGKCNSNLNSNDAYNIDNYYNGGYNGNNNNGNNNYYSQMYQSEEQEENEKAVCAFINMVTSGTYSDNGEIILTNDWTSNWRRQFSNNSQSMDGGIKAGLILSALAVAVMALWAASLHSSLSRKNIPWRPRRGRASADATEFSREQSGIVVGRSKSNVGTAPLI